MKEKKYKKPLIMVGKLDFLNETKKIRETLIGK